MSKKPPLTIERFPDPATTVRAQLAGQESEFPNLMAYLDRVAAEQPAKPPKPKRPPLTEEAKALAKERRAARQMPPQKARLIQWLAETYPGQVTPEYKFHDTRQWRFDWALVELKVAIEFDGVVGGKAHTSVGNVLNDTAKHNQAQLYGWLVIRTNTPHLRSGDGYRDIESAVATRRK